MPLKGLFREGGVLCFIAFACNVLFLKEFVIAVDACYNAEFCVRADV